MGLITLGKNFLHWTNGVVIAALLVNTKPKFWKLFWVIVLIGTMGGFFYQSTLLVQDYFQYQKTTVIRIFTLDSAPFPAVTVCNLNPFKKSALENSPALASLVSAYEDTLYKKSNNTDVETTSETATVVKRQKRQSCDSGGEAIPPESSAYSFGTYTINICDPVSYITSDASCGSFSKLEGIDPSNVDIENADPYANVFFNCFFQMCCDGCGTYATALEAYLGLQSCAAPYLSVTYPLAAGALDVLMSLVDGYATYCSLPTANCYVGYYTKPAGAGMYYYEECGGQTAVAVQDCDGNYVNVTDTACPNVGNELAAALTQALDDNDCGDTCISPCPFLDPVCPHASSSTALCDYYCPVTTTSGISTVSMSSTDGLISTTTDDPTTTEEVTSTVTTPSTTTVTETTPSTTTTETTTTTTETTTAPETTTTTTTETTTPSTTTLEMTSSTSSSSTSTTASSTTTAQETTSTTASTTTDDPTSTSTGEGSTASSSTSSTTPEPTTTTTTFLPTTTDGFTTDTLSSITMTTTLNPSTTVSTTVVPTTSTMSTAETSEKTTSNRLTSLSSLVSKTTTIASETDPTVESSKITSSNTDPTVTFPVFTFPTLATFPTFPTFTLPSFFDESSTTASDETSASVVITTPHSTTSPDSTTSGLTTSPTLTTTTNSIILTSSTPSSASTTPPSATLSTVPSKTSVSTPPAQATTTNSDVTNSVTVPKVTVPPLVTDSNNGEETSVSTVSQATAKTTIIPGLTQTTMSTVATSKSGTTNNQGSTSTDSNTASKTTTAADTSRTSTKSTSSSSPNSNPTQSQGLTTKTTENASMLTTKITTKITSPNTAATTTFVPSWNASMSTTITPSFSKWTAETWNTDSTGDVTGTTTSVGMASAHSSSTEELSKTTTIASFSAISNSPSTLLGGETLGTTKRQDQDGASTTGPNKQTTATNSSNTGSGGGHDNGGGGTTPAGGDQNAGSTDPSDGGGSGGGNGGGGSGDNGGDGSGGDGGDSGGGDGSGDGGSGNGDGGNGSGNNGNTSGGSGNGSKATTRSSGSDPDNGSKKTTAPSSNSGNSDDPSNPGNGNKLTTTKSGTGSGESTSSPSDGSGSKNETENEIVSNMYHLSSNNTTPTIEANVKQALISIAATLTDDQKEALGYKLEDLLQTCTINSQPCNMPDDFSQIYDVDYGYCYTFNSKYPDITYNTTRVGSVMGLRMLIVSDMEEYISTTSEQGIKIVIHPQNVYPFPNADGFKSSVGKNIDLRITLGKMSRLSSPFGDCNTLEGLEKDDQPFYFNGTYSVEGCYRSCFQKQLSEACGCADPRFPLPVDGITDTFCVPTDSANYECHSNYLAENGDYYNVSNCACSTACDETIYEASVFYSNYPAGPFFGLSCNNITTSKNITDCKQFYKKNAVFVEVSYARLSYQMLEEVAVTSAWNLFYNLSGNTGLWIGFSAVTLTEIILILLQILVWIFTKNMELPEVPSCRRSNYTGDGDVDGLVEAGALAPSSTLWTTTSLTENDGINPTNRHLLPAKDFANELRKRPISASQIYPDIPGYSSFKTTIPSKSDLKFEGQLVPPNPVDTQYNNAPF